MRSHLPAMVWLVLGLAAVAAGAEPSGDAARSEIDELWAAEGEALRALATTARGEDRGEALLRLGEWERESALRLQRQDDGTSAASAAGAATEVRVRAHLDAADRALSAAIEQASPERRPVALFALGDLRRSRGDFTGAAEPFGRLVEEYTEHPLAVDAAIASADDAFESGGLARAMERYTFAAAKGSGAATAYAWYRLAWCHINLEEFSEARQLLVQVIESSGEGRGQLALANDARRDLVLALARDASVPATQADRMLLRYCPEDRVLRYREGYVNIIADAGRDEEAAALLAELVRDAPPEASVRLSAAEVEIAVRRRDLDTAVRAARRLAEVLETHRAEEASRERAEQVLRVSAVKIHGEGRASKRTPVLESAQAIYEAYFRVFDDQPSAYDLHHHAGELLHGLGRPAEAEAHYTASVVQDLERIRRGEAPGKWLAAAAHGAVVAALEVLPREDDPVAGVAAENEDFRRRLPAPTPFAEPESRFVAACDRYLEALPEGEHAAQVAYRRALVLYRHHRYLEANEALAQVALAHPEAEVAPFAAEVALDALRQIGRYDDLAETAARFADHPELKARLGARLGDLREAALLAAAAREASFDQHALAAARYLRFVDAFPQSARADRALFNAAASLASLGRLEEAVSVRFRLLESRAESALIDRARTAQLDDLVTLGRFAEASETALAVAEATRGKEAADRLHDTIVFAEAAGDLEQAARLRDRYLSRHAKAGDAMAHATALVERAEGCAARRKAARRALAVAPDDGWRAYWHGRLSRLEEGCGARADAVAHARRAVSLAERVPEERGDARDEIAWAALVLAEGAVQRFAKLPLREPYDRTLPKKIEALHAAEAELAGVVERGRAAAAVCALVRSGLIHAELAWGLTDAPAPAGFNEEQQMLFREALAGEAEPLLDAARETLVAALDRAREAAVAPDCLAGAAPALARLAPQRYGNTGQYVARLSPEPAAEPMSAREVLRRAYDAPAAWIVAARSELAAGRPAASAILLDRLDAADPLQPHAREIRAQVIEALGRPEAALAAWHALVREFPDRPLARRVLADRAFAVGDVVGAREQLEALATIEPDDADVLLDLGVALRALGEPDEAQAAFRRSASLAHGRAEAHLNLGLLLCAEGGRPGEGLKALETFREAGEPAPDEERFEAAFAACRALAEGSGR